MKKDVKTPQQILPLDSNYVSLFEGKTQDEFIPPLQQAIQDLVKADAGTYNYELIVLYLIQRAKTKDAAWIREDIIATSKEGMAEEYKRFYQLIELMDLFPTRPELVTNELFNEINDWFLDFGTLLEGIEELRKFWENSDKFDVLYRERGVDRIGDYSCLVENVIDLIETRLGAHCENIINGIINTTMKSAIEEALTLWRTPFSFKIEIEIPKVQEMALPWDEEEPIKTVPQVEGFTELNVTDDLQLVNSMGQLVGKIVLYPGIEVISQAQINIPTKQG